MNALVRKEVNFITASKHKDKKSGSKKSSVFLLVFFPVLLFIGITGVSVFILLQISSYNLLTEQEQMLLQSPELAEKNSKMQELDKQIAELKKQKIIVNKTNIELSSKVELNQKEIKAVLDSAGDTVKIQDISYSGGILTITADGNTYDEPPHYVERLEKTGEFLYVDYTGFAQDVEDTGTSYAFTVNAVLNVLEDSKDEK